VADNAIVRKEKQASIPPVAIVICLALVAGAAGIWYLNRAAQRPLPELPPLTGDARAYVAGRHLPITNVNMEAHESYLKQQIVEITGNIGNTGNRVITMAEIYCVFRDSFGQVVLRRRLSIVGKKIGGLAPGETKPFRLPFDDIPESWNQAMPDIVIANIQFS
jgi:hypothetical protein